MGEQTNSQSPLSEERNDASLCVYFHYIEPVAKIKLSKYSGRVWLLKPSVLHSNENDLQNRMFALPYTGPRYTYRKKKRKKKGRSFFFLGWPLKKNSLMHRHFWLCVKLSNPAPYFRLRYLLPLSFFSSARRSNRFCILHTDNIIYSQLIITISSKH